VAARPSRAAISRYSGRLGRVCLIWQSSLIRAFLQRLSFCKIAMS